MPANVEQEKHPRALVLPWNGLQYTGKNEIFIHGTSWGQHWECLKAMLAVAGIWTVWGLRPEEMRADLLPPSPPSILAVWSKDGVTWNPVWEWGGGLCTPPVQESFLHKAKSKLLLGKVYLGDYVFWGLVKKKVGKKHSRKVKWYGEMQDTGVKRHR